PADGGLRRRLRRCRRRQRQKARAPAARRPPRAQPHRLPGRHPPLGRRGRPDPRPQRRPPRRDRHPAPGTVAADLAEVERSRDRRNRRTPTTWTPARLNGYLRTARIVVKTVVRACVPATQADSAGTEPRTTENSGPRIASEMV